jgi:hypothetical protein
MILPQMLWDDPFRAAGIQAVSSGAPVGFEHANAFDWRDFTMYRPAASTVTYLTSNPITFNKYIDSVAGWFVGGDGTSQIELEYETGIGTNVWVAFIGALGPPTSVSSQLWSDISNPTTVTAGRRLRWKISTGPSAPDIRILTCGPKMTGETGQWESVQAPSLTFGVVEENVIAVNGSIIARNVRRYEKQGSITLTLLTPEWVRATWEPFIRHAVRYPFWYRWKIGRAHV